jgi:SAM-dependent methyltransferase
VRQASYWSVTRAPGEDEASYRARAGLIYFNAQQQETAEWWRRIGFDVDLRGRRVLDIGCGHGALSLDAAHRGAAEVIGIDLDSDRIRFAREHLLQHHPGLVGKVRFRDGSLDAMPAGERFDVVLSKDTFEHVQELDRLLDDAGRRLRDDGLLVCGFSPLYYSPNGDHDRLGLPLPWLHALLPQGLVFRWASRRLGRPIRSAADVGLNRLTLRAFQQMLSGGAWEQLSLRINPIEHRLRPLFDLLRRIARLERYFTIGVYAVYRRRHAPAGCDSSRTAGAARMAANGESVAAPAPPGQVASTTRGRP